MLILLSSFQAFYKARELAQYQEDFTAVFASSNIKVYPYQIAAAQFAVRSPYLKGAVLCDESGMGKSHEAMLVILQKWLEGKNRILLAIPNADLLSQWVDLIEEYYTVPYITLVDGVSEGYEDNPFLQDGVIITTTDYLIENYEQAKQVHWDLTVFEEATTLSASYDEQSKTGKMLKEIAEGSFKLLLTGTPIEKNIMDLYGLIYFIDESVLPSTEEFLKRYLRKPENYPELAEKVSKYCFRTLRQQAKQYAKITDRQFITCEYTPSEKELELQNLLNRYIEKDEKIAFPQMDKYDLALMLLGAQGSSSAAILQTLHRVEKRLLQLEVRSEELGVEVAEIQKMIRIAASIGVDEKAKILMSVIDKLFDVLKKAQANRKILIFTESVATQEYLYGLLKDKYKTSFYNGSSDYSAIKMFKDDGEILISTDNGSRGFNLEEAACVINYDLIYNTLKMEQRIDRCHRLGQQNDVLVIAFIDKNNFADVRKLELINKRILVADGVVGITDSMIGGFTENIAKALKDMSAQIRTRVQMESDYQSTLDIYEQENKELVEQAENVLFTTFTKEISDKVNVVPQYVEAKAKELNDVLWELAKRFFNEYNSRSKDCFFEIDDEKRTVTATNYTELPRLFYYVSGGKNKPYKAQKCYGMDKDFKPRYGKITLSSIIGQGIINEVSCADSGKVAVNADVEPCTVALYDISIYAGKSFVKNFPLLVGKTEKGQVLSHKECEKLLELPFEILEQSEHEREYWLKTSSEYHEIDRCLDLDKISEEQTEALTPAQEEEVGRIKLAANRRKNELSHDIAYLERQVKEAESKLRESSEDRLNVLVQTKKLNLMRQEFLRKQENKFFQEMQIDVDTENQINEFLGREKLTAKAVRQFVIEFERKN